ncbi:MAG TPA: aminoglycoside phosphotransferase family protein [Burkholderiales bacterium]|nr:aminoglycoside phosphotransferase family protein [Burkholderiales bacterium]
MNEAAVSDFLQRAGLGVPIRMQALSGGVSSDIWRVELPERLVCVKRALPRLRVAQVWEAPIERNRYERQWLQVARKAAPASAPQVLAWDDDAGLFAMEHLAYPVWKTVLREGHADPAFASQVGERLAAIHGATAGDPKVAERFATDAIFYAIRLEPYLVATAPRHPDLAEALVDLAKRTAATRHCLVHGDVSPKNILVGAEGPIFLDAECAWYGDPAFDLAFCLNHMLLKCIWVPDARAGFMQCFDALASAYLSRMADASALEERAATLLPGLLLGRIDGKSPVEYLDEAQRALVRSAARRMLCAPSPTLKHLRDAWQRFST